MGTPKQCKKWRQSLDPDAKLRQLAWARDWKRNHPEQVKLMRAAYYKKNKTKEREQNLKWLEANPGKKSEYDKRYRKKHAQQLKVKRKEMLPTVLIRMKKRYKTNVRHNIECRLRASLNQAIRLAGVRKSEKSFALIGCSPQQLVAYIESKFLPGMSWMKRRLIHIDHIRPAASFDLSDPEQQRACFHYSNLQPLWALDNRKKGSLYKGIRYLRPIERRAA